MMAFFIGASIILIGEIILIIALVSEMINNS